MANPVIPRDEVHRLAEACSDDPDGYESVATRLMRVQRRVGRFVEQNAKELGAQESQIALYMCSVCLRIFEQVGGRLNKVSGRDLDRAAARIFEQAGSLFPADKGLPERVRQVEWRAQPHLLDEVLWALYEKEEREEGEIDVEPEKAALIFLTMWAVVEALDGRWVPPRGYQGEQKED